MDGSGKTIFTPWGWHQVVALGEGWQIKLLHVDGGHRISLQKHRHRDEWWYVLEGEAIVTIGRRDFLSGDVVWTYVPVGREHRLTGIGDDGVTILELQIQTDGSPIREADIERLADDYGRK